MDYKSFKDYHFYNEYIEFDSWKEDEVKYIDDVGFNSFGESKIMRFYPANKKFYSYGTIVNELCGLLFFLHFASTILIIAFSTGVSLWFLTLGIFPIVSFIITLYCALNIHSIKTWLSEEDDIADINAMYQNLPKNKRLEYSELLESVYLHFDRDYDFILSKEAVSEFTEMLELYQPKKLDRKSVIEESIRTKHREAKDYHSFINLGSGD